MRKRKRQAVKKLIQCAAVIAVGVLAIILFMLAIWYRGKNSEPVTDEQVAAQMQQAEPLVIETPEAATEGSIRVYDYDGCCIYSYYGKIRINSDGKDGKEIDVEALGYLEGYQEHKEEDWAWYFATFIANGIFPKPSDGLQVVAYSGMEIRVNAGYAFINGYAFRNPATLSVTLDTAEGALNRVDRVVVRWDLPQRDMYIAVLKGTPSAKPTATAVTRTTEIWELALADIYVGKGVTRIQTQNITDQRFNSAVCGIVTGTVEEIDASVLTKQFTDFFNTYSAAVLDEFSAYKQSMEKYLTEIAGVYDSYVSKTEGLFAQYESQFNERYSSFESTLDNWDKELLSAYTEFMAKIKLFQSDAENEFNTWFESIKDKLGEDIAGSLQLQIEELAAAMQEVKKQAEAGTKETKEAIAALDERLKRVESGWGIDYKHDAVLGLCYMGAAYMSQHYERTVETAVLGATYVGNSYLANTF